MLWDITYGSLMLSRDEGVVYKPGKTGQMASGRRGYQRSIISGEQRLDSRVRERHNSGSRQGGHTISLPLASMLRAPYTAGAYPALPLVVGLTHLIDKKDDSFSSLGAFNV